MSRNGIEWGKWHDSGATEGFKYGYEFETYLKSVFDTVSGKGTLDMGVIRIR